MKIDVIIPVYRPGKELFALLDAIEAQTLPVNRIILMNTEKSYFDELVRGTDFEAQYPNARVYHLARREFDHGGTRHRAVQCSDGDVFVCMTQDAMPVDRHLLERLTARLSGDVGAAYARQLPGNESSEFERSSRSFILRRLESRPFSAPTCARRTAGTSMRNWAASSGILSLMRI